MAETESLIPVKVTTIKSCKCYAEYWKTIKKLTLPYVVFDYSIEKTL